MKSIKDYFAPIQSKRKRDDTENDHDTIERTSDEQVMIVDKDQSSISEAQTGQIRLSKYISKMHLEMHKIETIRDDDERDLDDENERDLNDENERDLDDENDLNDENEPSISTQQFKRVDMYQTNDAIERLLKYIERSDTSGQTEPIDEYKAKIKDYNSAKNYNKDEKSYTYCIALNGTKHYVGKGEYIRVFTHLIESLLAIKHKVETRKDRIEKIKQAICSNEEIKIVIVDKNLLPADALYRESLMINEVLGKHYNSNINAGLDLECIELDGQQINELRVMQNQKLDQKVKDSVKIDENLMMLLERASNQVQIRSHSGRVTYKDISNSVFFTLYAQKLQTSEYDVTKMKHNLITYF